MFYGIGWMQYTRVVVLIVLSYYIVIAWVYRKEWLRWWRERNKR
jgi:hypothetical protein